MTVPIYAPDPSLSCDPTNPRALHSLPTRRSSDLSWPRPTTPSKNAVIESAIVWILLVPCVRGRPARADHPGESRRWRSEEHTSELQSRENIVCRLLLEKKKRSVAIQTLLFVRRSR